MELEKGAGEVITSIQVLTKIKPESLCVQRRKRGPRLTPNPFDVLMGNNLSLQSTKTQQQCDESRKIDEGSSSDGNADERLR